MTATGSFSTDNGQIIGPNGQPFVAAGINVYDSAMGDATQILQDFPGINFVRLNVYSYQSPSAYQAFINTMTAHGVVVELEDHTNSTGSDAGGGVGSAFTGQQLTNELNWYSAMASAYANNPYVWFGTDNEPPQAGLSSWEQETYNAIRTTGNNNPVIIEVPGGGYPGGNESGYGMDPSVYSSMTNIIADVHFYGWDSNYSTNQQTVDSALSSLISGAQTITSADGTVPVIIGEFGNSESDTVVTPNWQQVLNTVTTSGYGYANWNWDPGGTTDDLTTGNGTLTAYGQQIAAAIAATAAAEPTTPTPTPVVTPSANDTAVMAGSTAAITDASGNKWTITSGAEVAFNGTAISGTANVTELAYVNGVVWQENSAGNWYSIVDTNGVFSAGAGPTATSPLPATPTPSPTASPNDTVVLAGSSTAITDASDNKWTITSTGQVAFNGTAITGTANVEELAYVKGTIWQETTSSQWYSIVDTNGSFSTGVGPTTTNPLPARSSFPLAPPARRSAKAK